MNAESKAKSLLIVVSAILLVVVVAYAIFSGRLQEVNVPGGMSIKLTEVNNHSTVEGVPPTVSGEKIPADSTESYYVEIPGRGKLNISAIDTIYIEAPANDFQEGHKDLVLEMLQAGEPMKLYEETDKVGKFSTWITMRDNSTSKKCFNYTTLYEKFGGTSEAAFRLACPNEGGWTSEISPAFIEAMKGVAN